MSNKIMTICPKCIEEYKKIEYTSPFQWRGIYTNFKVPENHICHRCGTELVDTLVTRDEMEIIFRFSKDNSFIQAMMKLKETDPIEYQIKLQQLKPQQPVTQHQTSAYNPKPSSAPTSNGNASIFSHSKPTCPTCGSTNVREISGAERAVSILGLGIFSKKINKSYKCMDCRCTW